MLQTPDTFENDLDFTPELALAKRYVAQWDSMKAQNMGLLLWGGVGTGKSFFAGCIANALLAQGVPVLMTNFAKILGAVTGMYGMERQRFLSSLNTYSLLILDDLGAERNSEYALEQLFGVVDSRYQSRKPMIVTTNLTLEELKHPFDLAHERIYDRLLERCVPVKMNGKNIRTVHIFLRLTDTELDRLNTAVQKSGLSREVYLRKLIDGIQPRELPPPDFYPMMRQLYYCGNHLNQIARKAHALGCIDEEKYDEAVAEFRGIVEEISRKMV